MTRIWALASSFATPIVVDSQKKKKNFDGTNG